LAEEKEMFIDQLKKWDKKTSKEEKSDSKGSIYNLNKTRQDQLWKILQDFFRPEFLNRLDDVIIFDTIWKDLLRSIVTIQLETVIRQLKKEKNITLKVSEHLIDYLGEMGYDPVFGARPIKRAIQRHLLNPLSTQILLGTISEWASITADEKNGEVIFKQS
jgi:ATP-dependent Clp protease ATP-binding subunit ClpB